MNKKCSGCGHEAIEGEMFTITVDTSTAWGETLFETPQYCNNCRPIIKKLNCKRCGHSWYPKQQEIRICPKCKSPYWDRAKVR